MEISRMIWTVVNMLLFTRYMAPEVGSKHLKYSYGADIFSLGCILAFYCNRGKHLFYR